jgi:hypothetical protein
MSYRKEYEEVFATITDAMSKCGDYTRKLPVPGDGDVGNEGNFYIKTLDNHRVQTVVCGNTSFSVVKHGEVLSPSKVVKFNDEQNKDKKRKREETTSESPPPKKLAAAAVLNPTSVDTAIEVTSKVTPEAISPGRSKRSVSREQNDRSSSKENRKDDTEVERSRRGHSREIVNDKANKHAHTSSKHAKSSTYDSSADRDKDRHGRNRRGHSREAAERKSHRSRHEYRSDSRDESRTKKSYSSRSEREERSKDKGSYERRRSRSRERRKEDTRSRRRDERDRETDLRTSLTQKRSKTDSENIRGGEDRRDQKHSKAKHDFEPLSQPMQVSDNLSAIPLNAEEQKNQSKHLEKKLRLEMFSLTLPLVSNA